MALPDASATNLTPKRGGTFRLRGEDPTGFDPHLVPNHPRTMTNLSFTHSRLVKIRAGPSVSPGTLPIEPDLAESWTQPNSTTYVFTLRKGVRWHDKAPVSGRELTAEDVKYTYERFLTVKGNPTRAALDPLERIDVVARYTVKLTLHEPCAWFLDYLATTLMWIIPREAVELHGDLRKAEVCIGTGPLMLERYEPGVRLSFVRNPNYFLAGLPYVDAVQVIIDDDPASRLAAWLSGAYDFAPEYGMCVRRIDLDVAKTRKPGLQTQEFTSLVGDMTMMKIDKAPFKDLRVRRALALARSWREELNANANSVGVGVPNATVPTALKEWSVPIDQLSPRGRQLYEQDLPEARKLLAQAGYPQGFKTVLEATQGFGSDYLDGLQVIARSWKEAGVTAELNLKEFGAFMASTFIGKFPTIAHSLRGGTTVADAYLYGFHLPGQAFNTAGVDDSKLARMILLQRSTSDRAKRRELVCDIQRYLAEQAYYLYGPSATAIAAWEPYVKNFAPNLGHDYGGRLMVSWLDK